VTAIETMVTSTGTCFLIADLAEIKLCHTTVIERAHIC